MRNVPYEIDEKTKLNNVYMPYYVIIRQETFQAMYDEFHL